MGLLLMSTLTFRTLAVGTSLLIALAVGSAKIAIGGLPPNPGMPVGGTPGFTMTFDENGNATINGQPVPMLGIAPGGGIVYPLPGPVFPGFVNVFGPSDIGPNNPNGFSDLLQFQGGGPNGGVLIYSSLLDDPSAPDLADVVGLLQQNTPFSVIEFGPEGNNGFVWIGPNDPTQTLYQGISDIPEPSTFILGGLGLIALFLIGRRRWALKKV